MTRHLSKANKLRDVNTIRSGAGNITVLKRKLTMTKSKSSRLSYILDEINPSKIDRCKSKNGASVSEVLAFLGAIRQDKFD